jgi:peptide chain release factor 1
LIDAKIEETILVDSDLKISWFSGTGKGGQRKNKVMTCCRMVHVPSGLSETRSHGKSREQNYQDCKSSIEQRLKNIDNQNHSAMVSTQYKESGSGQRGDKVRTIRFQDNQAWDERTGKIITAKSYMNGGMKEFWCD